jgi:hypothetical protein
MEHGSRGGASEDVSGRRAGDPGCSAGGRDGQGAEVARLVGERIRRYVEGASFAIRPERPMQVTISVGVAALAWRCG